MNNIVKVLGVGHSDSVVKVESLKSKKSRFLVCRSTVDATIGSVLIWVFCKKRFIISQISQENSCVGVSL